MRCQRIPERSSSFRKSASVYSETTTRSGRKRDELLHVGLLEAVDRGGTRPTTFDVPGSSAQRVTETRRSGGRISTSTSSAERLIEATRCGWAASARAGRRGRQREQQRGDAAAVRVTRLPRRGPSRAAGRRRRSRRAPRPRRRARGSGCRNIGPSQAKVWNSPFSPQGSTPAGRSASSARVEGAAGEGARQRPRVDAGERAPAGRSAIISSASSRVGRPQSGNRGRRPGRREALLAVAPHVLEEQVAEGDGRDAASRASAIAAPSPPRRPRWGRATGCGRSTSGRPAASACASSSARRTACIATRSWASLTWSAGRRPRRPPLRAGRGGRRRCPCRCSRRAGTRSSLTGARRCRTSAARRAPTRPSAG